MRRNPHVQDEILTFRPLSPLVEFKAVQPLSTVFTRGPKEHVDLHTHSPDEHEDGHTDAGSD